MSDHTETTMQDVLQKFCEKHELTIPNCGMVWGWESDLASVTKTGMTHDFEIKISRADWLSEYRQMNGSERTAKMIRAETLKSAKRIASIVVEGDHVPDPEFLPREDWYPTHHIAPPPNYFWMATTIGVIGEGELPPYAGHIIITGDSCYVRKQAPRLHTRKIFQRQLIAMAKGLSLRYWSNRKGGIKQVLSREEAA